jgi:hypothetical protein
MSAFNVGFHLNVEVSTWDRPAHFHPADPNHNEPATEVPLVGEMQVLSHDLGTLSRNRAVRNTITTVML